MHQEIQKKCAEVSVSHKMFAQIYNPHRPTPQKGFLSVEILVIRYFTISVNLLIIIIKKKTYIYRGGISQDVKRLKMLAFYPLFFGFS